jgi:hypothetical protein
MALGNHPLPKGDGEFDDAAAIRAQLNAAVSDDGSGEYRMPRATYLIKSPITPPAGVKWTCEPGTVILVDASMGASERAILISVSNVTIEGLELDGNKDEYTATTEQRHGIMVTGDVENITLRDLYLHDCKGDGLYIGSGDGTTTPTDVTVDNVRCLANHRQGCSVTSGRNLTFTNCRFAETSGTAPQAGVDVEPNNATAVLENITFRDCHFYDNAGAGLLLDWPTTSTVQKGVTVVDCFLYDNTGSGIAADQVKGFTAKGNRVYSNGDRGIVITDNCRNVELSGNRIYLNGTQGIYVLAQANTKYITGLQIKGNRIYDNSATTANAVDAIRIDWAAGAADGCVAAIVTENNCANQDTTNQRYAITTDGATQMTDLILSNNNLDGCATGVSVLSDEAASRRVRGNVGLADN